MVAAKNLSAFLRRECKRHEVPGASLAVLRAGKIVRQAQAGTVNLATKVAVTPDAVFQIGSITKPLTATLVMQMVDEGLVALDAPLVTYLPEFRVARTDVAATVTLRELLSHTSGIEGDFFVDSGRGDEATRRFIDKCTMVPSLFERGEMMSYCNLGFAALGRLLEVMRRQPFDQVMQERIFTPLGMTDAFASPEQAIRFNCAIGHLPNPKGGGWQASTVPYLSMGQAAAGAVPSMSATDLLQVARLHLNHGQSPGGAQLLSRRSVRAMQRRQVKLPRYSRGGVDGWGLGWILMQWGAQRVYGHDGGTIGQAAFLRVFPEKNIAFVLLTNGGRAGFLMDSVCREVIRPMVGVDQPDLPEPAESQPDLTRYVGTFENMTTTINLSLERERLVISNVDRITPQATSGESAPLTFIDRNTARVDSSDANLNRTVLHFSRPDELQRPQFVQTGFRQYKRAG